MGNLVYGEGFFYEILPLGSGQTTELIKVDNLVAKNVLEHIKEEFPELADTSDWADLTDDKITSDFVERLKLKAYRGDFKGKCPACPDY